MTKILFLESPNTRVAYRIYENDQGKEGSTAVFIHGAGVGGEITWDGFLTYLGQWQRVIIPDLCGMGDSYPLAGEEAAVSIHGLAEDMLYLLDHLAMEEFDLIGYSLGGLVSLALNEKLVQRSEANTCSVRKMALLEPAALDRESVADLIAVRQRYRQAAHTIRVTGDVEQGVAYFMESVAPNRRKHPVAEATTQSRLAHRPLGFAYALDAVTDFVEQQQVTELRQRLLQLAPPTLLFAGELSHQLLRAYHAILADTYPEWQAEIIKGTDHSLPFQKPRQIAGLLNQWFHG